MRTVFVQSGFGAGGAEKIVGMLAHHREELGDTVDVIAVNTSSTASFFAYKDTITLHALAPGEGSSRGGRALRRSLGTLLKWARLRRRLRQLEPDLVLSFLTKVNIMVGIATIGLDTTTIMSERNNFRIQKMHPVWRMLRPLSGRRACTMVMQTQNACASLPERLRRRAVVIPNPVMPAPPRRRSSTDRTKFVAVGRLESQKGFDLLLQAFARVVRRMPAASLVIFGEGPERGALEEQVEALGLKGHVSLPGVTKSPQDWLEAGCVFVLSSRFEGFPNVLLEALMTGMAAVAFDCPWGPSEILRDAEDMALVPPADVEALADALLRVASDSDLKRRLEELGPALAARYSKAAVFAQWDALIRRVAAA